MTEEKKDVNEVPTTSEEQTEEIQEETPPVKEDVKTKDYKQLYENARAAFKEEREKRKKQEEVAKNIEPPVELNPNGDEGFQRFLRAEADAYIAKMVATDPTFRDRIEMVEELVAEGNDIKTADTMAKARLMDEIIKQSQVAPEKPNKPTKTETAAVPEEEEPTAPSYADVVSGKDKSPEAQKLRQAMKSFG